MRRILALLASVIYLFAIVYHGIDSNRYEQQAHMPISYHESYIQYDTQDISCVDISCVDIDTDAPVDEQQDEILQWWTDYELDLLAAVIYHEAGSDECSDRHQQLVGQVVINRMNSDEFPNTIYDVITQVKPNIQYSTYKNVVRDAGNRDIIPQRCYDNALAVLNSEVECPDNIVWQANFKQGSGVYEEMHTSYSVSYFCYR